MKFHYICWCVLMVTIGAAEIPKAPVPKSPYITVVYKFADTMIERGRDTNGPQKTGLFLSALDRNALGALTNRPPVPAGIMEDERAGAKEGALTGANLYHDENLLRLLYMLSDLSAKPKYREAADTELKWFLQNTNSLTWNVMKDEPLSTTVKTLRGPFRPWMLADRCFDLASIPSKELSIGNWQRPIVKAVGDTTDPRSAGFQIRSWAVAYARTQDEQFLQTIEALVSRLENRPIEVPDLSLAIDCDGAAHRLPEQFASRLRKVAAREDDAFCARGHNLKQSGGFSMGKNGATSLWKIDSNRATTAQVAMMCVSRYDNTSKTQFRDLILAAADAYLKPLPAESDDAWPLTFGQAISLELAAWRSTARPEYLNRARELGDYALQKFFGDTPLPRASLKSDHYESITGADTLMLGLVELHLQILHITAVRYPPNTIDR